MANIKKKNRSSTVGKYTHCTSYGVLQLLPLRDFKPPEELKTAFKNYKLGNKQQTSLSEDYVKLINSFSHLKKVEPKNYFIIFKICLYLETFEFRLRAAKHDLKMQTLTNGGNLDTFVVTVPTVEEDDPFLCIGDRVKLITEEFTVYGKIVEMQEKQIYIQINPNNKKKVENRQVNIKFIPSDWSMKCCHYALNIVHKNNLIRALYPKINTSYSAESKALDCANKTDWVNKNVKNNPEQKQAITNIVNNTAYPAPYILFGPPGTGKTMALVEAICQIRKQYISKNILICTSSNAAADEIMKRLLSNSIPCKDIYRMYSPRKNWLDINKNVRPCTNFVDSTCIFLPKEIFILKKIVIATLITCTRLARLNLQPDHFSYVFIDEAGQCTEVESLIPISLVSSLNKNGQGSLRAQVVLAGDPHQLGPSVWCKEIEHLLGYSMLERLMESKPYQKDEKNQYNPRYITKLLLNFRCQESIMHVSNDLFYNDEVICTQTSNKKFVISNLISNKIFPILFIQCRGKEMYTELRSVYNNKEVDTVCLFVRKFMAATLGTRKVEENDIGIITPFKQQKNMIQKELYKRNLRNITVGTVETFQGQEKEIMIVSTVRSKVFNHNGKTHIGFLSNPKRFNVAVTRAKNYLLIIGNPEILCIDSYWKALWDYCQEHNACVTI